MNPDEDEFVTVQAKALLTMSVWIESVQHLSSQAILITDSHSNPDGSETIVGIDGVTGAEVEITIKVLP